MDIDKLINKISKNVNQDDFDFAEKVYEDLKKKSGKEELNELDIISSPELMSTIFDNLDNFKEERSNKGTHKLLEDELQNEVLEEIDVETLNKSMTENEDGSLVVDMSKIGYKTKTKPESESTIKDKKESIKDDDREDGNTATTKNEE